MVAKITRKFLLDVTSHHANPTRNINGDITDIGSITFHIFRANRPISMGKSNCLVAYVFSPEHKSSTNPTRILILQVKSYSFSAGLLTLLPDLACSVNGRAILLRNEFRPDGYAVLAIIRRYGKSARWSLFWSPSGDLGFPAGHNSSLTPNASSSLRASQFIQHPWCPCEFARDRKTFLSEKSTCNCNAKYSSSDRKICKKNILFKSNIFCSSNLMKFVYVYMHITFIIFDSGYKMLFYHRYEKIHQN